MLTASKIYGFVFIALAILVVIDLYTFSGFKTLFKSASPKTKRISNWAYWIINLGFLIAVIGTSLVFSPLSGFHGFWYRFLAGAFFALYVPKIFFIIFLLLEDAYRLLRMILVGVFKLIKKDEAKSVELFQSRRRFIANTGALVAAVPFTGIMYGVTKGKYNFKIHKVEISFKDLPQQFNGIQITQVSDIHSGSFDDRVAVQHAVDLANEQKSDIMFFTGDLVNNRSDEMKDWMDVFSKLKAPMGVYSILGNHDYGDYVSWPSPEAKQANMEQLYGIHKQLGFKLLRNENMKIERNGAYVELLGLENWGRGGFSKYGDLKKTLEGTQADSFKILLSHDPTHWEEQVMNHPVHIQLTLAGHTHGAQFGVEIGNVRISPAQLRYNRWAGLYEENNKYLYVNRGLGFIGFPGRVGIWPEITVITLKTA
jgi:predicted MPP superfamily phosphohydrolase